MRVCVSVCLCVLLWYNKFYKNSDLAITTNFCKKKKGIINHKQFVTGYDYATLASSKVPWVKYKRNHLSSFWKEHQFGTHIVKENLLPSLEDIQSSDQLSYERGWHGDLWWYQGWFLRRWKAYPINEFLKRILNVNLLAMEQELIPLIWTFLCPKFCLIQYVPILSQH